MCGFLLIRAGSGSYDISSNNVSCILHHVWYHNDKIKQKQWKFEGILIKMYFFFFKCYKTAFYSPWKRKKKDMFKLFKIPWEKLNEIQSV